MFTWHPIRATTNTSEVGPTHSTREDMKNDHVDGYCICKVLVQNSPVLHLHDHVARLNLLRAPPTHVP